jgi:hypothetical protein
MYTQTRMVCPLFDINCVYSAPTVDFQVCGQSEVTYYNRTLLRQSLKQLLLCICFYIPATGIFRISSLR